jgi:hypothetical protein
MLLFLGLYHVHLFLIQVVAPENSLALETTVPFTLEDEVDSLFVVDNLDLAVGEQSLLLAAMSLASENPVKLVARVVKQNRGGDFLTSCKFAYDPTNGTVYVKVDKESDVILMAGLSFEVLGQRMSFYRILSLSVHGEEEDVYETVKCRQFFS